ncbi:ABC transporter ATP-binding protein [Clostridium formicaceticum]|nr:ABC transporter ATP-binding protein [Clostridium formicaceticum]AOY75342.1 hypothetical protein BJL90_05150 [Clostridium formicaceticum]
MEKIKNIYEKANIYVKMLNLIKEGIGKYFFLIIFINILISTKLALSTYYHKTIIDTVSKIPINMDLAFKTLFVLWILEIFILVFNELSAYIKTIIKYRIDYTISKRITDKMAKIKVEVMENIEIYDLLDRVNSNVPTGIADTILLIIDVFLNIFKIISFSFVLINIKWYFPIVSILTSIPYLFVLSKQGFDTYIMQVAQNKNTRKLNYLFEILTNRVYSKEIRTFNLIDFLVEKIYKIRKTIWDEKIELIYKHSRWTIYINILKNISIGICLFITCIDVIQKRTSLGSVVLVISAIQNMIYSATFIMQYIAKINKQVFYINDFNKFILMPEEEDTLQKSISNFKIVCENISFSYPNTSYQSLDNINLTINENEIIAIVGENGSGKTTFINLLLGIFKPTSGAIYVGDRELPTIINEFRKKSVCIFQNFIRYQFTVEENINAGNFGQKNRLKSFYAKTFLDFVNKLPFGYNTELGQLENGSIELSGGEWQKIAICRALCREDLKLIILDEPMSALDPKVESDLYHEFRDLCKNKQAIMISHRLGATKVCDRIYVFDKGKIIENGTHEELIKKGGKYYKMYKAQQSLYV